MVPDVHDGVQWVFAIAAAAILAGLAILAKRLGRGPLTATICYLALLFPALGFFNVYPFRFSFVADHFQYLAGIPIVAAVVWVVAWILRPLWQRGASDEAAKPSAAIAVLASALLVVLGATSWIRATVFEEPENLWQDTVEKNPDSWLATYSLAKVKQADASEGFDDAARIAEQNDVNDSQLAAKDALSLLDDSDHLLNDTLANASTPDDVRYKALDQFAENDITRMRTPDSNATALLEEAENKLKTALTYEEAQNDPLPYYTLGIVELNRAQELEKTLGATTRASEVKTVGKATTRPFTAREQEVVDLLRAARDEFRKAGEIGEAQKDSPTISPEGRR